MVWQLIKLAEETPGTEMLPVQLDVTQPASIASFIKVRCLRIATANRSLQAAVDKYGRIDVLVNNAGASGPPTPALTHTEADWDAIMNVNVKGPWLLAQGVAKAMDSQSPRGGYYHTSLAGAPMMLAYQEHCQCRLHPGYPGGQLDA